MERAELRTPITSVLWDERNLDHLKEVYEDSIVRVTRFKSHYRPRSPQEIAQQPYIVSEVGIPALGDEDDNNRYRCEVILAGQGEKVSYQHKEVPGVGQVETARFGNQAFLRVAVAEELHKHSLQDAARIAYLELFRQIRQNNFGNLVRNWNFIPNILGSLESHYSFPSKEGARDRYQDFNIGRQLAWKEAGPKDKEGELLVPAATGIGAKDGSLVIEAWLTQESVQYVQNSKQRPPVKYGRQYGPMPPIFTRATILRTHEATGAIISGTASLLGEDVVFAPPVLPAANLTDREVDSEYDWYLVNQVDQTLENIRYLLSPENLAPQGVEESFSRRDLTGMRVYVKYQRDYWRVKEIIGQRLDDVDIVYVEDDICRAGWLLEIEGMAWK